jgi:hypothetical protein
VRSDEAIQNSELECFAEPVIGSAITGTGAAAIGGGGGATGGGVATGAGGGVAAGGAVGTVNRVLGALDLEKHPVKTFIGRIERGFDFLGYRLTRARLSVARKTNDNFLEKASRLYEQECRAALPATALEMYVKRWVRWATSGRLKGVGGDCGGLVVEWLLLVVSLRRSSAANGGRAVLGVSDYNAASILWRLVTCLGRVAVGRKTHALPHRNMYILQGY